MSLGKGTMGIRQTDISCLYLVEKQLVVIRNHKYGRKITIPTRIWTFLPFFVAFFESPEPCLSSEWSSRCFPYLCSGSHGAPPFLVCSRLSPALTVEEDPVGPSHSFQHRLLSLVYFYLSYCYYFKVSIAYFFLFYCNIYIFLYAVITYSETTTASLYLHVVHGIGMFTFYNPFIYLPFFSFCSIFVSSFFI